MVRYHHINDPYNAGKYPCIAKEREEAAAMRETTYHLASVPGKLALLSDLHNRPADAIITSLSAHKPDVVLIAGDIFYSCRPLREQENVLPFLKSCADLAPTFLSLGNHEQAVTRSELQKIEATGVVVLDNAFTTITVNDVVVTLGGLSSEYVTAYRRWKKKHPRQERPEGRLDRKPDLSWLPAFAAAPRYHILLSHHPEYISLIPEEVELVCSGHAHGGQIRIFNYGLFAPGQGWWPKYSRGVHDGRLIVSAGLSNTTWVPRIGNPTEIVYISPA